jgi:hypothetical protein
MTLNVAVSLLLLAGAAQADFVLIDAEHLDVTTYHPNGELWETSTADVLYGGSIGTATVNDTATLRVLDDGAVISELYTYNSSTVGVSAGSIYELYAGGTSRVDIYGGRVDQLYANDSSSVAMSAGSISWQLYANNSSSIDIRGGSIWAMTSADTSSTSISGGTVSWLNPGGTSSMRISGGNFPLLSTSSLASVVIFGGSIFDLRANDTSNITLRGYEFELTGGLWWDGDRVKGTGILIGKWWGGAPWTIPVVAHGPDATIWAISTPPHPGDANFDDLVNGSDLGILAGNWNQSGKAWPQGDFTGEGDVNVGDLGVLAGNWGWSGTPVPGAPVPEPAALSLLALGGLMLLRRRR